MPAKLELTPESLLSHLGWVRNLAGRLVADGDVADDLAQDAVVRAMQQPPHRVANARGWLTMVLRNLVLQRDRAERARRSRERQRARREHAPSTDAIVARSAQQKRVVTAVFELDEPYRTTILLRFFEELPPAEIARRLDIPVSTVKTRLARALERLRRSLDREFGSRSAWVCSLSPLAEVPPATAPVPLLGLGLVNTKAIAGICTVALGCVLFFALSDHGADATPSPNTGPTESAIARTDGAPSAAARRPGGVERTAVAAGDSAPARPAARPTWTVRGRVLGEDGLPVAGFPVRTMDGSARAESDGGGWFDIECASPRAQFVSDSDEWSTISKALFREGSAIESTLVVARTITVSGRTLDPDARTLPAVKLALRLPSDFFGRFDRPLANSETHEWYAASDDDGAFELRLPAISGSTLAATKEGYAVTELRSPLQTQRGLQITLRAPGTGDGSLEGIVLTAAGTPAAGARVALWLTSDLADDDGRFSLALADAVTADRLVAVLAGHLPGELQRGAAGWPRFVELHLGGRPKSITGVVVDSAGEPVAGANVWVDDPTPFGNIGMTPVSMEGVLSGAEVRENLLSRAARPPSDGQRSWNTARVLNTPSAAWSWTTTDEQGRFRLEGLMPRAYRLKAFDPETLLTAFADGVAAEGDVEIVLPREDLLPRVTGRVVDRRGRGVPRVSLSLFHEAFETSARVFGGRLNFVAWRMGKEAVTDASGRFELEHVPARGAKFWITKDNIVPTQKPFVPTDGELRLVVEVRYHFKVELRDPDTADQVAVRDGSGARIQLMDLRPNSNNFGEVFPLHEGRSPVLAVTEDRAELVLLRAGSEVAAIPLALVAGEVTVVRH